MSTAPDGLLEAAARAGKENLHCESGGGILALARWVRATVEVLAVLLKKSHWTAP